MHRKCSWDKEEYHCTWNQHEAEIRTRNNVPSVHYICSQHVVEIRKNSVLSVQCMCGQHVDEIRKNKCVVCPLYVLLTCSWDREALCNICSLSYWFNNGIPVTTVKWRKGKSDSNETEFHPLALPSIYPLPIQDSCWSCGKKFSHMNGRYRHCLHSNICIIAAWSKVPFWQWEMAFYWQITW